MKVFSELTEGGIKRRLGKVVELALEQYDIHFIKISFLDEATNMFYKIETSTGEQFAAKVVVDECILMEDNKIEAFILEQLENHKELKVPKIINNIEGQPVTVVKSKYTPTDRRVIIYKWFDGLELDGNETEERFIQLGEITAKLHNSLENTQIPNGMSAKKWDQIFYFKNEVPVYKDAKYQKHLSKDYHRVMDKMIAYCNHKLPTYYDLEKAFIIHGDLNASNIKIIDDEMVVFDFEDNMYGTPLHDLAIILFGYWLDPDFEFEQVKDSVLKGYSNIRPLPKFSNFDLELLMTSRRVNFLNYILLVSDSPEKFIERNLTHVMNFMDTYNI